MNRIKNKIKDTLATVAVFGFVGSIFGLIGVYFIGVFCMPIVIIWAIYKVVTHFLH